MKSIIHIKLFVIRCFLILGVLIYLLSPFKSSVFNFLHFLSHKVEFFKENGHKESMHHSHNFQSVNRFAYSGYHGNGSNSNHKHSANNGHHHGALSFIASLFISVKNKKEDERKLLSNTKLDEHLFSEIFNFYPITLIIFQEKEWRLNSTSYSISIDVTTPPPQMS